MATQSEKLAQFKHSIRKIDQEVLLDLHAVAMEKANKSPLSAAAIRKTPFYKALQALENEMTERGLA